MTNAADDSATGAGEVKVKDFFYPRDGKIMVFSPTSLEVWEIDYDPAMWSFTDYVWPEPKA